MAQRMVTGAGGVRLAVFTEGDPDAPAVVLVHGYPDTHQVWDTVAGLLSATHHVVRYDVRGAGGSDAPRRVRAYRLPALADDLFAVIAAVSPDRPVHVVGHDWGSVQAWEAVTDGRAPGRIAGFTSISGPCLDHIGQWARQRLRRPTWRGLRQLARQMVASWYIHAFHIPGVAAVVWRLLARRGHQLRGRGSSPDVAPTLRADAIHGIRLYRANMVPRLLRPRRRTAGVPVQLITLSRDRFVNPALGEGLPRWAPDLRRDTVDAGHWSALFAHAPTVAALVRDFMHSRAQAPRP
jgi:pimeloyl-ACP methyl ester carboxylesterase